MCGVDNVYRLKLYATQIKTKCLLTSETIKFSSKLLNVSVLHINKLCTLWTGTGS